MLAFIKKSLNSMRGNLVPAELVAATPETWEGDARDVMAAYLKGGMPALEALARSCVETSSSSAFSDVLVIGSPSPRQATRIHMAASLRQLFLIQHLVTALDEKGTRTASAPALAADVLAFLSERVIGFQSHRADFTRLAGAALTRFHDPLP